MHKLAEVAVTILLLTDFKKTPGARGLSLLEIAFPAYHIYKRITA